MKDFGKWSVGYYRSDGNGSKQFGGGLWWNSSRIGLDLKFWAWEFVILREWK